MERAMPSADVTAGTVKPDGARARRVTASTGSVGRFGR